MTAHSELMSL